MTPIERWKTSGILAAVMLLALAVPSRVQAQVTPYAFVSNSNWPPNDAVSVIRTDSFSTIATIPIGGSLRRVVASPDGQRVYVTSVEGQLHVLHASLHTLVMSLQLGQTELYGLAVTPDGRRVYVCDRGADLVHVIETATNTVLGTITVGDGPSSVAITPNGQKAYVSHYQGVDVLDLTQQLGAVTRTLTSGTPLDVAVTPDGVTAYAALYGGILPIDVATDTAGTMIPLSGAAERIVLTPATRFSPTNQRAYVIVWEEFTTEPVSLNVIDLTTLSVVKSTAGQPFDVGIAPNGDYLYATPVNTGVHGAVQLTRLFNDGTVPPHPAFIELEAFSAFIGMTPNSIVHGVSPLSISQDSHLTYYGFDRFVIFDGGRLHLAGAWTTSRNVSIQSND